MTGDNIIGLFEDFRPIEQSYVREGEVEALLKWAGKSYPCWVATNIINNKGKIEGVVYVISLPPVFEN
jgi:hypothetical protein